MAPPVFRLWKVLDVCNYKNKGINLTLVIYESLSNKGEYADQIMVNRWLSWKARKPRHKAEETCLLL